MPGPSIRRRIAGDEARDPGTATGDNLTRPDHQEQFAMVQSPSYRRVHPSVCRSARSGPARRKSN